MSKYLLYLMAIALMLTASRIDAGCFSKSTCDKRIDNNCYVHIDEEVTWNKAEDCCVAWGGHLASIHSSAENYFLDSIRNKNKYTWIGLNDIAKEGTFVWTDGTNYDYKIFSRGQPDNYKGKEDCVHFWDSKNMNWNDLHCNHKSSYICEKKMCPCLKKSKCDIVLNDQCYLSVDYKATWQEAERCCVEWGGHLASIHSELENCVVNDIRDKQDFTWIGLSDQAKEGSYVWTDGTAYDYNNFGPGQPDNYKKKEHCIHLFNKKRGDQKWNDYQCNKETDGTVETSYVCKKPYNATIAKPPTPAHRILTSHLLDSDE